MKFKAVSGTMLTMLLIGMLSMAFPVAPVFGIPAPSGGGSIWVEPNYVNGSEVGLGNTFVVEVKINISDTAGDPDHLGMYAFDFWFGWNDTLLELVSWDIYYPSPPDFWEEGVRLIRDVLEDTNANAKNDIHKYAITALGSEVTGFVGIMMVANYTFRIIYSPVYPEPDLSCVLDITENEFADWDGDLITPIDVYDGLYEILNPLAHNIGISNVTTSRTIIGQGYSLYLNTTIRNHGVYTESFNISVYANTTIIATSTNITLTSGKSTTITFTWNTTDVPHGNYTISANATIVPRETATMDNTFIDGTVTVTIFGDFDGDGEVDIGDVRRVARAYLSATVDDPETPWDETENWDPVVDVRPEGGNGKITIADVREVARHYGETWP